MLRWLIFACVSTWTWCSAARSSLAFLHELDAPLVDLHLYFHMNLMLRCLIFISISTWSGCSAAWSSLAFLHEPEAPLLDLPCRRENSRRYSVALRPSLSDRRTVSASPSDHWPATSHHVTSRSIHLVFSWWSTPREFGCQTGRDFQDNFPNRTRTLGKEPCNLHLVQAEANCKAPCQEFLSGLENCPGSLCQFDNQIPWEWIIKKRPDGSNVWMRRSRCVRGNETSWSAWTPVPTHVQQGALGPMSNYVWKMEFATSS